MNTPRVTTYLATRINSGSMATATYGSIGEFDSAREDWVSYTERLEQYFTANDIKAEEEDKRRAILLSVCGASTYQLIRNLVSPSKPTDKTFAQLVKLVQDHHQSPPSAIVQERISTLLYAGKERLSVNLLPVYANYQSTAILVNH